MHSEFLHVNSPPVVSFSDDKILKLDLVFGFQGWRNLVKEKMYAFFKYSHVTK